MTSDSLSHHFGDVNGVRLHYVSAGKGPLVIFLHGFPEFWHNWRDQLRDGLRWVLRPGDDQTGEDQTG